MGPSRRAALGVLATVVLVGAVVVALAAMGPATEEAAPSPPSTQAAPEQGSTTSTAASTATTAAEPPPTAPGPEVGTHSAAIDDLHSGAAATPVRLTVGDIEVDAPVSPAGVATDGSGELEVPARADAVVWYRFGPSPGSTGSAVLAGHVDYDGVRGSFFRLAELTPGAVVSVAYDDGSQRRFEVRESHHVAKAALPTDAIFSRSGPPRLHLITCGGSFDASAHSYRDNVVVEAVPLPG